MTSALRTIADAGSTLWLDSVDPDEVQKNRKRSVTGATSNPKIVADLVDSGRFDDTLNKLFDQGHDDEAVAWHMTDHLVNQAQEAFAPHWNDSGGQTGYVSFELDPLLEDPELGPDQAERTRRYIELGKRWSKGHTNRMIKVPATPAGIAALPALAEAGVTLNVTLIFTERQYTAARDAIWQGAQKRPTLKGFKSVYSIFISRVDVYTQKHVPSLSAVAQGQVGLVNAKRLWQANDAFWADKNLDLKQEIVFASTGTKLKSDPPDKYVGALVGDGILTNPPETNDAIEDTGKTYHRSVDLMPGDEVLGEIDDKVDMQALEDQLMQEGVAKFADPHKDLLKLIGQKRDALTAAG